MVVLSGDMEQSVTCVTVSETVVEYVAFTKRDFPGKLVLAQ